MRVLWDSRTVATWLAGDPTFRHRLRRAVADFGPASSFFVSAVTTQDLLTWAKKKERTESTSAFLRANFTSLDFTPACALEAKRLATLAGYPKDAIEGDASAPLGAWKRAAAIAATANQHGLDVVFTGDPADFARFAPYVTCKVWSAS